jgi:signal transduction histidine kinase
MQKVKNQLQAARNKITKENIELRDAIKRRTIELEKKNRELEIEASLERVRVVAMGMRNPDDILDICKVMFTELKSLGFSDLRNTLINFWDDSSNSLIDYDYSDFTGANKAKIAYSSHPVVGQFQKRIRKSKDAFAKLVVKKEHLESWRQRRKDSGEYDDPRLNDVSELYYYFYSIGVGAIGISAFKPLTNDNLDLLKRFRNVFVFAYRRYLDVAQAEAQTKEAQIEAALERVRARAMAMHTSMELKEVSHELRRQLGILGLKDLDTCVIHLYEESPDYIHAWAAIKPPESEDDIQEFQETVPKKGLMIMEEAIEAYTSDKQDYVLVNEGSKIIQWLAFLKGKSPEAYARIMESSKGMQPEELRTYWSFADFTGGSMLMVTTTPPDESDRSVLRRFSNVFGLAYRRFADLKQAEARAKEAQIETALERVRSRSMAMHKSEELLNVITIVSEQLQQLNFKFNTVSFAINNQEHDYKFWFAVKGNPTPIYIQVPYVNNPMFNRVKEVLGKGPGFYTDTLTPEESRQWHEHVFANADLSFLTEKTKTYILRSGYARSVAIMPSIMLIVSNYAARPYTDNENDIIRKFATVFQQSYTRFLDLQKAEEQAREAQVEAALERVRSKAMAMHNSEEFNATIGAFYRELKQFSITPRRCGVGLMQKENRVAELSTINTTEKGESVEIIGRLKLAGHPVLEGIFDNWLLQKEYHPVLRGNEIKEYYHLIRPQVAFPEYPNDAVQFGYFFPFTEGGVYAWTEKEMKEDELMIYRKFTTVLSLTYKRYKDLKDAEANAHEAVKRASLDRVRAEIASMRTTGDLERIQPLIWNELKTLDVPFIRCGVFIMDEAKQEVQVFLSTPDGKSIAAFRLPYSTEQSKQIVTHWKQKQLFKDHMDEAAFSEYAKNLVQQGAVASDEKYVTENRPTDLYLHFLPFLQGMLYVGNDAPLQEDALQLVQNLADAFATAYARYDDFRQLEEAKNQIEKTFTDLKAAQSQLIHSEKMASLGELTAGIAHEIQNPLNFVNNFSEVNKELLTELKDEMSKGNLEEANAIANDVLNNEQKINHHGKRADAIVKGMLQHSRSSNGLKEPTDINALADEYLRLSYHGLRAKDKTFNASFKTDFDPTLPKINAIPQDIGRVLLNLINNAFYAVASKALDTEDSRYKSEVIVTTKNHSDKIEIAVKDNGPGIPVEIKDKIFQPFFTTKPTGQGTGLGLSLSYDIVKAHGGEIRVESKDGNGLSAGEAGTEFIIQLPV